MKLNVTDLRKSYGPQRALNGLNLSVPAGTHCLALIGPSGGGKSTLLRHLGGLEIPDSGQLEINDIPLRSDESWLRNYRRSNGFLFQGYNLFPHFTALENIVLPLVQVHGKDPAEARQTAMENLRRFGLDSHAQKFPTQLSGGQQQRVALIRALVANPKILFLDEPTAALDPEMTAEVLTLIRQLIREGLDIIVCTHEMGFARAVADAVAFVADGKILECASPPELFTHARQEHVRKFLSQVLEFR